MKLIEEGRDELLLVLPADHVIEDQKAFQRLALATNAAENGEMVSACRRPVPKGYGYIRGSQDANTGLPDGIKRVAQFVEKPDEARAQSYLESGDYYWNSGMFLFRASVFLDELKKHDPDIYDTCWVALERSVKNGDEVLIDPATFACCPDNSIDYAVMERQLACGSDVRRLERCRLLVVDLGRAREGLEDRNLVTARRSHDGCAQGQGAGRQETGQQARRPGAQRDQEPLRRVPPLGLVRLGGHGRSLPGQAHLRESGRQPRCRCTTTVPSTGSWYPAPLR